MSNKRFTISQIIFSILSIICMILIFRFSCENADTSSETSGHFTEFAVEHFVPDFENLSPENQSETIARVDHIIRKCAHFSIYAALGFLLSFTFGKRKLLSDGTYMALLIAFIYACTDELHQYFVPGRSCQFTDVLIDTSGAVIGILVSFILSAAFSKISHNAKSF